MNQATNIANYSKAFTVRFPAGLRKRLKQAAMDTDTTMQAITIDAVTGHLDRLDIASSIRGSRRGKAS